MVRFRRRKARVSAGAEAQFKLDRAERILKVQRSRERKKKIKRLFGR